MLERALSLRRPTSLQKLTELFFVAVDNRLRVHNITYSLFCIIVQITSSLKEQKRLLLKLQNRNYRVSIKSTPVLRLLLIFQQWVQIFARHFFRLQARYNNRV